jgi:topoisomerase-4 subunit A
LLKKTFVGKDIIHVDVWKKNDERTTYNVVYLDGETGRAMAKRFNVTAITRDKEYELSKGHPKSKVLYFSVNPDGEAEKITIQLTTGCSAKIKQFDFDFASIEIKGRSSLGNIITKYPVRKITLKEKGLSTLGSQSIWYDEKHRTS